MINPKTYLLDSYENGLRLNWLSWTELLEVARFLRSEGVLKCKFNIGRKNLEFNMALVAYEWMSHVKEARVAEKVTQSSAEVAPTVNPKPAKRDYPITFHTTNAIPVTYMRSSVPTNLEEIIECMFRNTTHCEPYVILHWSMA